MPNESPTLDPKALIALLAASPVCICALADVLCECGIVERAALIAGLERKLSDWRGGVPDPRMLAFLQALVAHLRRGGKGAPTVSVH